MKLRVVVSLLAFLSFSAAAAYAQETPKLDVFAGYSYVRENPNTAGVSSFSLNGGSASAAYHVKDWLSGVANFGGYHNGNILGTHTDGTLSTYLFGPRVSYRSFHGFLPFGQALFGVAHAGANIVGTSASRNAFGMALGGGVDYRVNNRFSIRPLQVDYLLTRFPEGASSNRQNQNNLRASAGVVVHF